jgi:hypothetical protein
MLKTVAKLRVLIKSEFNKKKIAKNSKRILMCNDAYSKIS